MDKLQLLGIKFQSKLGVYAWERQKLKTLQLDLVLGIENQAKVTDNLDDTVDYAKLVFQLRERYIYQSFQLLESLAEDIASFLLKEFNILRVEVHLVKLGTLPDVGEVSIYITRDNQDS